MNRSAAAGRRRPAVALTALFLLLGAIRGLAQTPDPTAAFLGGLKGDESTYVAMAASLAYDGDLTYTAADYGRFRTWYGSGPEGIFLKRDGDGALWFGKAFVHAVVAAPLVWAFGLGGLLMLNGLCLVTIVAAGAWWLAPRAGRARAVAFAVVFLAASMAPIYAAWLTSDLLTFALVFCAFCLGVPRAGEVIAPGRLAAALGLLALAIFSKPIVVPLMAPLALANGAPPSSRRALAIAAAGGGLVAVLFGANALITGEANYQGGDRQSFYGRFPFDERGSTFETAGEQFSTQTILTPVGEEGRAATVLPNLGYFVAGRHFGLIPFGWPWLVVVMTWLLAERQKRLWQVVLLASLVAVALVTILWMPYTWSGGGGPIGNRYFLSVAGAVFVLMPAVASWRPVLAAAAGLVFLLPTYRHPVQTARQPWLATRAAVFAALPLELTGASDFPEVLDQARGRIPQGRDPQLSVALLDGHAGIGRSGWVRVDPAAGTSLLLRSPRRLATTIVGVRTTRACRVRVSSDRAAADVPLADGERRDIELTLPQVFSRDSFVGVVRVDATPCADGAEIALQGRPAS